MFLLIPATLISLIWAKSIDEEFNFLIMIIIFAVFLLIELVLDHILEINFRSNWKLLAPYLVFYYAANYSIIMLNWNEKLVSGIAILVLVVVQIVTNIFTHN